MSRFTFLARLTATFLIITLLLPGCGLFGGAQRERERENVEVTQGIEIDDVVTAEGVGENNAPVNESDDFSSSQDVIYVIAEAEFIEEGTALFARWYRDDEPIEDSSEIVADRDYQDTYIEFHLENLENRFEEGDYSVQIFANGNPVGEADFRID